MTLLISLFSALAAIPSVFKYIEKFATFINEQIALHKRKQAANDFKKATQEARETKDTSGIDAMFNPDKRN